jgi:Putative sugar-binding domain
VEDRIIGLTWEDVQELEHVVGVVSGPNKTEAIIGGLRTGLLDYLIVGDRAALELANAGDPSFFQRRSGSAILSALPRHTSFLGARIVPYSQETFSDG